MFRGNTPKQIGYMMNNDVEFAQELDVKIDELIDQKITEPLKYKVIFMNDDATPNGMGLEVLIGIFQTSHSTAEKNNDPISTEGSGTVGIYTYEVAEQKAVEATNSKSCERGFLHNPKLKKNINQSIQ